MHPALPVSKIYRSVQVTLLIWEYPICTSLIFLRLHAIPLLPFQLSMLSNIEFEHGCILCKTELLFSCRTDPPFVATSFPSCTAAAVLLDSRVKNKNIRVGKKNRAVAKQGGLATEWPLQGIQSEKVASGRCSPISTNHVALFGLVVLVWDSFLPFTLLWPYSSKVHLVLATALYFLNLTPIRVDKNRFRAQKCMPNVYEDSPFPST